MKYIVTSILDVIFMAIIVGTVIISAWAIVEIVYAAWVFLFGVCS